MGRDLLRQILVTVSGVLCVYGTLIGTGVIGTRVEESSGGRLAADATLIAPAGPAFTIWSVIYTGLFAYVVWQWLPNQRTSQRHRSIGYLAAASMVLNAAWLLVTQQGWIAVSVVVILLLLACLTAALFRLQANPVESRVESILVDGTFGLYLGWVCVATAANIAAALVAHGVKATGKGPETITVIVIAAVAVVGVLLAKFLGARLAVASAAIWGLCWVVVGRLADQPHSALVGSAALVAALVIAFATIRSRRTA